MKRIVAAAAVLVLAGCATSPDRVPAAYVSPITYQGFSCKQLAEEAERVSVRAAQAAGLQQQKAGRDAVAMTVGMVVFWPALFLVGGDQGNAAELARLKGEMQAIEEVNRSKHCGITFASG